MNKAMRKWLRTAGRQQWSGNVYLSRQDAAPELLSRAIWCELLDFASLDYLRRTGQDLHQHGGKQISIMPQNATVPTSKWQKPVEAPISQLLTRLTPADLIAEAGGNVRTMSVRKNKDIVIAGKQYQSIYVNHDGWLSRYKVLHNGSRQIVDFILPGQIFGLQACLFNKSLYSVATVTDTSVSVIPFEMIDSVFERSPRLAKALFWSAACEAAILAEHLIDAARRSAYERVSHLLLELFLRLKGAGLTDDMSFNLPLTQELIGDALGLTTVHVNRTIRSLREDKLIAIHGRAITILDFEGLSLVSDFENSYLASTARAFGKPAHPGGDRMNNGNRRQSTRTQ